jgi:hypothetical protein
MTAEKLHSKITRSRKKKAFTMNRLSSGGRAAPLDLDSFFQAERWATAALTQRILGTAMVEEISHSLFYATGGLA